MQLKSLSKKEVEGLPVGTKFYKMNKLKIEFVDGDYNFWDSGITKTKGMIICIVEKMSDTTFKITGGQLHESEQSIKTIDTLLSNDYIIMLDKDEIVRLWVDNATKTLNKIEEFNTSKSKYGFINLIWSSNAVQISKDLRPELWI